MRQFPPSCQFSSAGLALSSSFLNPSKGLCYHAGSGGSGAIYATFWESILLWHSIRFQTVTLLVGHGTSGEEQQLDQAGEREGQWQQGEEGEV